MNKFDFFELLVLPHPPIPPLPLMLALLLHRFDVQCLYFYFYFVVKKQLQCFVLVPTVFYGPFWGVKLLTIVLSKIVHFDNHVYFPCFSC